MRRLSATFPLLAALLLGAACAVLVACGSGSSDDLIPDRQAETMIDQLDTIQSSVSRGRCSGVNREVAALQNQINDLPRKVDARLRNRLQEGVNNLASIAPDECLTRREEQTQTETTPTETTPPETTTTETTPTQTTPTETTPTVPPETTPTVPPETTPTIPPETTPVVPPGGATVPGDTGGVGGATPDTGTP